MTVDGQITDSASDAESLDLCDVYMCGWVVEELSESKIDKKDSAQAATGTYHEVVWFNIKMNVMVIMQ
jgi:hypothetical protein